MLKSAWEYIKDHATEALVGIVSAVGLASVWATVSDIISLWSSHALEMAIWSFVCILAGALFGNSHNLLQYQREKKVRKIEQINRIRNAKREVTECVYGLSYQNKKIFKKVLENSYADIHIGNESLGFTQYASLERLCSASEIKPRTIRLRLQPGIASLDMDLISLLEID
ncbi:hypothetical protein [Lancefieldella rimae]